MQIEKLKSDHATEIGNLKYSKSKYKYELLQMNRCLKQCQLELRSLQNATKNLLESRNKQHRRLNQ